MGMFRIQRYKNEKLQVRRKYTYIGTIRDEKKKRKKRKQMSRDTIGVVLIADTTYPTSGEHCTAGQGG